MIAQNIAYQALLRGHTVLFTSASTLLSDLGERDAWARNQRLRRYVRPQLLAIDEVGYLSYDNMLDKPYAFPLFSLDLILDAAQSGDDPRYAIPHERGALVIRKEALVRAADMSTATCDSAACTGLAHHALNIHPVLFTRGEMKNAEKRE